MITINIKPLSVNEAWQGRRFKTKVYDSYILRMKTALPVLKLPEPPYCIQIIFGVTGAFDIDNGLKPFLDILSKKYGFNDNKVHRLIVDKEIVKFGNEFIKFNITKKT